MMHLRHEAKIEVIQHTHSCFKNNSYLLLTSKSAGNGTDDKKNVA